jgi:hypothetical protein
LFPLTRLAVDKSEEDTGHGKALAKKAIRRTAEPIEGRWRIFKVVGRGALRTPKDRSTCWSLSSDSAPGKSIESLCQTKRGHKLFLEITVKRCLVQ